MLLVNVGSLHEKSIREMIVCNPPPLSAVCWGGGVLSLRPNFQKGGLDRISVFRGEVAGKEEVTFSREVQFLHKNKLKSKIFNDKKVCKQKYFFPSKLRI